jgi:hypothetical protein
MPRPRTAFLLTLLALAPAARAQDDEPSGLPRGILGIEAAPIDEPLVTDRPDFTESTLAVPLGRVQVEAGLTFTRDGAGEGDHAETFEAPEVLLRIGLVRGFELRLGAPNYAWEDDGSATLDGLTDMGVGFKLELGEQDGARPSLAVLGELSIPTGDSEFTSDEVDPTLIIAWAYDLGDSGWSVAGNLGASSLSDGSGDRFEEFTSSLALGIPLADGFGAYAEYYGFYRHDAGAGPEHYFNTGVTYLINNNTQLDFRVGAGLNGRADDFFTGAGVSFRF